METDKKSNAGWLILLAALLIIASVSYGLFIAAQRLELSETAMFNEQLTRSAELLAHEKMSTRRVGVRVLEDLINSAPDDDKRQTIGYTLNDFIRARAGVYNEKTPEEQKMPEPRQKRADIVLALQVLTEAIINPDDRYEIIDLTGLDLRDLRLNGIDLSYTNLEEVHLEGARLMRAHLEKAHLMKANLERANLWGAHLTEAHLERAHLEEAHLEGAHLEGAELWGAHLEGAHLTRANLWGTPLAGAFFYGARLWHADISRAGFGDAEGLTQEQLDGAIYEEDWPPENLPDGLEMLPDRAYDRIKDGDDYRRQFVKSGKWVDEEEPPDS